HGRKSLIVRWSRPSRHSIWLRGAKLAFRRISLRSRGKPIRSWPRFSKTRASLGEFYRRPERLNGRFRRVTAMQTATPAREGPSRYWLSALLYVLLVFQWRQGLVGMLGPRRSTGDVTRQDRQLTVCSPPRRSRSSSEYPQGRRAQDGAQRDK